MDIAMLVMCVVAITASVMEKNYQAAIWAGVAFFYRLEIINLKKDLDTTR